MDKLKSKNEEPGDFGVKGQEVRRFHPLLSILVRLYYCILTFTHYRGGLSLLCRTGLLFRHLSAPSPRLLWPYVSVALPLVGLNKETGLSVPLAALPGPLFGGETQFGPAELGPVQWQRCH